MNTPSAEASVHPESVGGKACYGVVLYDASGNIVWPVGGGAASSALTNVAANVASVTVLAANAARLAFILYNDSTSAAYIKLGATASATSFTKRLLPNELWATPDLGVNYTGRIDAIWDAANGNMRVTELSA